MFELKLENEYGNIIDIDDGINYIITDITGLNPPTASLFKSKSPNRKGTKINGSTLEERNVVISVKILGDVEQNRNNLYPWINSESYVKIHFRNDTKRVYCEGYVEECDFTTYTDNEIISLAICCGDPYWKDFSEIVTEISSLIKHFSLPFSIQTPIPFSSIKTSNATTIYNYGTENGLKFIIFCTGEVENLTIYNPHDSTENFQIRTILQPFWRVEINTDVSPKTVIAYKPDGTTENLLKYVAKGPTWFTLKRGNNSFGYMADSGETNVEMTVSFNNKYQGV